MDSDLVQNCTLHQLHYILSRIKALTQLAPEKALEILSNDPKLAISLIHAEYLVGARGEKLLPMTSDEVKLSKERLFQLRSNFSTNSYLQSSVAPKSKQRAVSEALSSLPEGVLELITGSQDVLDVDNLVERLLEMTDEQIAELPEEVQKVLLEALQV
jgi:hypothetical protein